MSSEVFVSAARVPWIERVDSGLREELLAGARLQTLERGDTLPIPTHYAFVTDGMIKVARRHPHGRDTILHIVEAGGLLLDGDAAAPVSFVALVDGTRVLGLGGAEVARVLAISPTASHELLLEVRRIYLETRELAGALTITPLPRRIAWILARLARRFGVDGPDGARVIPMPLSRQDIADLSGTTLETAIRVMSRLRSDGVVKSARKGLEIKKPELVERIAAGEERLRARVR